MKAPLLAGFFYQGLRLGYKKRVQTWRRDRVQAVRATAAKPQGLVVTRVGTGTNATRGGTGAPAPNEYGVWRAVPAAQRRASASTARRPRRRRRALDPFAVIWARSGPKGKMTRVNVDSTAPVDPAVAAIGRVVADPWG